jgi:hypothetical protein
MPPRSLDVKLAKILADPDCGEFVLADAKDADMAYGLAAPGKSPEMHAHEGRFRTLQQYRELIRQNTAQGLVDIMLMSASTNEVLALHDRIFDDSHVTPAIRANDTTDIWLAHGAVYPDQPARPFRSAHLSQAMCGEGDCPPGTPRPGADLGLYSVTFNNDTKFDHETLERYGRFREEAEAVGFRHFLEVFEPNAPRAPVPDVAKYLSDMIVRTLAGVAGKQRPLFLKVPYHGPAAMEALAGYDRSLIVGILGGSSGTTHDAFHQLADARKHGARVALYGRMINHSEHQPTFIQHLRRVADGDLPAEEACRSYHAELEKLNVTPYRPLDEDLQLTLRSSGYAGGKTSVAIHGEKGSDDADDFAAMTPEQKVQWNLNRWDRVLG